MAERQLRVELGEGRFDPERAPWMGLSIVLERGDGRDEVTGALELQAVLELGRFNVERVWTR
jgi:hypothetical protein